MDLRANRCSPSDRADCPPTHDEDDDGPSVAFFKDRSILVVCGEMESVRSLQSINGLDLSCRGGRMCNNQASLGFIFCSWSQAEAGGSTQAATTPARPPTTQSREEGASNQGESKSRARAAQPDPAKCTLAVVLSIDTVGAALQAPHHACDRLGGGTSHLVPNAGGRAGGRSKSQGGRWLVQGRFDRWRDPTAHSS